MGVGLEEVEQGRSEETTGGLISKEAELQLVNLLQVEVGGLFVQTAPTESKTSSRLESIENDSRQPKKIPVLLLNQTAASHVSPSETAAAEMLFSETWH